MNTNYRGSGSKVALLGRCRELRINNTDAERRLWSLLRSRQLGGAKFRRQHQFGPYILDYFCAEHCLAVEVDGGQHFDADQASRDVMRTRYLKEEGLRVLRFTNREVLQETEAVTRLIWEALGSPSP
ncbi:MAG: endonuclease domain-containing protein [Dehalococcoidia bacterium]|nr:endonuclease domain-containing protein [Dehalococcoidia bacterium]